MKENKIQLRIIYEHMKCARRKYEMKKLILIMTTFMAGGIGTWMNNQEEVIPTVNVEETQPATPVAQEETTPVYEEDTTPVYQHNHNGDCLNVDCPLYEENHNGNGYSTHQNHGNGMHAQQGQGNGYGHHGNHQ